MVFLNIVSIFLSLRFTTILMCSKLSMNFYKNKKHCHCENNQDIKKIATADLQQITKNFFQVIRFMVSCNTILHWHFQRFERFEPYARWNNNNWKKNWYTIHYTIIFHLVIENADPDSSLALWFHYTVFKCIRFHFERSQTVSITLYSGRRPGTKTELFPLLCFH